MTSWKVQKKTISLLEGSLSVSAALRSPYRTVHRVLIREDRRGRAVRWLEQQAREANVPVVQASQTEIDGIVQGTSHGGIIAEVGTRRYVSLNDLLPAQNSPAFVVMIDGIEDPFNFGHTLRALYAVGIQGLVLRPRNWMSAAGTVARSSAGASELMPIAIAETVEEAAMFYRREGLAIACAQKENAIPIDKVDLSGPLFLLVGGEKRGITRSFVKQATLQLQIPYGREFAPSLGTTAAAAVLAYEVMRQRKKALSPHTSGE